MLRKKLNLWTLCLLSLFCFTTNAQAIDPAKFNVTSDNAYRFGLGDQSGIKSLYNLHWFDAVWNNNVSQIQNAESYPVNSPNLAYDYFYIACYGGYSVTPTEHPYADVVVVIDESTSMQNEQLFTSKLVHRIETTLIQNKIGADHATNGSTKHMNRYGLVGFGGPPEWHTNNTSGKNHVLGHMHGASLSPHGYKIGVSTLESEGGGNTGGEDGYSGIMCALHDYPWRQDAKKFIILVTDENRDDEDKTLNYNNVLSALGKHEVTLNVIVTCNIGSKNIKGFANPGGPPVFQKGMAINYNGTVFISGGLGTPYTTSPGGNIQDGTSAFAITYAQGTVSDYAHLAFATGGMAGDISIISDYGTGSYASASGKNFANIIASQVATQASLQKNPYRGVIAEVVAATQQPSSWFYDQAAKWEVYATGDHGFANGIWSATNPPSITEINNHITLANNVGGPVGLSSLGWVDEQGWVRDGNGFPQSGSQGLHGQLVTGEQNNSNSGYFNIVSPMNQATRWMWYNPKPVTVTKPFEFGPANKQQNDGGREFLIFRLKATRRSSDDPRTNPSTTGPSRTGPSRTGPSRTGPSRTGPSRTNPSRTNPGRTDRPTIRPPLDGRPLPPERGSGRTSATKPTEQKPAPQKSDREKSAVKEPAVKKPAERKEVKAQRVTKEPANRSVLLKK
jgi:hypothetical protein